MIYMQEDFYHQLRNDYSGICTYCYTVRHGETEPDAENYECDECGKPRVQGIENLLIMGRINFEIPDDKSPFVKLRHRVTNEITEKKLNI